MLQFALGNGSVGRSQLFPEFQDHFRYTIVTIPFIPVTVGLQGRGTGCNTLLEDFDYLIARSDGNLYQCVFFMTEGKPIGNIADQPLLETLHHALDLAEYEPFTVANDRCASCLHSDECGTGCRGYAYLYDDDWLLTDPRCAKTEPLDATNPPYFPLCPIMKLNVRSGLLGGSTEQALERSVVT